jgi:uncharacterized YccA/Bax inhibitor family protein
VALFKSANPALEARVFARAEKAAPGTDQMCIQGTVNKCAFLLSLLCVSAVCGWIVYDPSKNSPTVAALMYGGELGALFVGAFIVFKKRYAPSLAWAYALLEGFALGVISRAFDREYPGIVAECVCLTIVVLAVLLVVYKFKSISVTENVKLMTIGATVAIGVFYLVGFTVQHFDFPVPIFGASGLWGVLLSHFIAGIAALNMVVDFDFIEQGSNAGIPKYFEWYGAFGMTVTLVWLYVEFLRLLAQGRKRNAWARFFGARW